MQYTYDTLNRLSTVVDNRLLAGANTTSYVYDPANNLMTASYPNGLQSTFVDGGLNSLRTLKWSVAGYQYTLGPMGNRLSGVESSGGPSSLSRVEKPQARFERGLMETGQR